MSSVAKDSRWTYALAIAEMLKIEWDDLEYSEHIIWLDFGKYLYETHGTP